MDNPFSDLAAPAAAPNPFSDLAPESASGANPFEDLGAEDPGSIRVPYTLGERAAAAIKHPFATGAKVMSAMTGHAFDDPETNLVTGESEPNPLQLVASPLRMVAKAGEEAAGAGASKLSQTFPDLPPAIPAVLGTAAAMGADPMLYIPEGEMVKFSGAPSVIAHQAAEGAEALGKLGKGVGKVLGLKKGIPPAVSSIEDLPGPEAVSEALKVALGHDPTEVNLQGHPPLTPEEIDKMQRTQELGKVRPELQPVGKGLKFEGAEQPENPFADLGELEPGLKATAGPEGAPEPGTSLQGLPEEEVAQEVPPAAQEPAQEVPGAPEKAVEGATPEALPAAIPEKLPEEAAAETKPPVSETPAPTPETVAPKKRFLEEFLAKPEAPVEVGAPNAVGKESVISAGSATYNTRYKVVPMESLVPSHDPYTFRPNPKYPERVQERNYDTDKFSQEKVVEIAKKLNPANVLSDTPLATDGPPVVTPSGLVMGGNNRAMSLARAITDNPEGFAAYKAELESRARNLGISQEDVATAGEHPVLIREMQDAPTGRHELAQVSRNLNEDLTKGKDAAAEAVSLGRAISDQTIEKIRDLVADPESTLGEVLGTQRAAKELVPLLSKDGVLAAAKMNEYVTPNGNFTDRGMQLVQDALLGHVLQDRNLVAELPNKARQGILKILPDLVRSRRGDPEWDLTAPLREAAEIITQAKQSGLKAGTRLAQKDFFQVRTPEAEVIARLLDGKIGPLRDAFAKWQEMAPKATDYDPAQVNLLDMDAVKGPVGLPAREAFHQAFAVPDQAAKPANPMIGGGTTLYSFPGPVVDHAMQLWSRTLKALQKGHLAPMDEAKVASEIFDRNLSEKADAIKEGGNTFKDIVKLPISNGDLDGVQRARRFFDPQYIIPRIAEEVSNITDRFFDAKGKYLTKIRDIYRNAKLTREEGQIVAMALDAHATLVDPRLEAAKVQYRAVLDRVADLMKLPRNLRLTDYFPHILDHETAKAFRESGVANLGEDGKAAPLVKSTVNVHQLHRFKDFTVAPKYSYDLLPVLETYVNTVLKKSFFNHFVDNYTKIGMKGFEELSKEGPWVKKYAENYLAQLQGRPTFTRQFLQDMFGEISDKHSLAQKIGVDKYTADRLQRNISRAYYRSLLGLAVDTATKNLFQITNTIAETGFINTGKAVLKLLTAEGREKFRNAGVLDEYAKTMEGQAELLSASNIMKHVDAVLFTPMRFSEYVNRGVAYHAGIAEGLSKGIRDGGELNRYAKHVVDKTQFRYGIANTSPYMNNPLSKLAYQFSTYPMKEYQFIRQLMKDPDKAKMVRMLALHGMAMTAAGVTGVNVMNAMGWERAGDMAIVGGYVPKGLKNVLLPTQAFSTLAGARSPFLQGMLGLVTGPKGRQLYGDPKKNAAMLAAGMAGVPLRALNKGATMADEMRGPGYERKGNTNLLQLLGLEHKGEYTHRIRPEQSLSKFLGGAEPRKY